MEIQDIAKALVKIREQKNLTQYKIGKLGMNMGTIRAIEEGKSVTLSNLIRYCEIVGAEIVIKEKEGH